MKCAASIQINGNLRIPFHRVRGMRHGHGLYLSLCTVYEAISPDISLHSSNWVDWLIVGEQYTVKDLCLYNLYEANCDCKSDNLMGIKEENTLIMKEKNTTSSGEGGVTFEHILNEGTFSECLLCCFTWTEYVNKFFKKVLLFFRYLESHQWADLRKQDVKHTQSLCLTQGFDFTILGPTSVMEKQDGLQIIQTIACMHLDTSESRMTQSRG